MSNVTFRVGPEGEETTFFGHKLVLSMSSPVFVSMLLPPKETGLPTESEIIIPDVHPTAFMSLLRFLYRQEIVVNQDFVGQTLFVAEKYDATSFVDCLAELMTFDSVFRFYPFIMFVGVGYRPYNKCWEIIKNDTSKLLKSECFLKLEQQATL